MISELIILIVVDVEAALASNNIENNIYIIDNNPAGGAGMQGSSGRISGCSDGQVISWELVPVDSASSVAIQGFSGKAVPHNINPAEYENGIWGGAVSSHHASGRLAYTCTLIMDGKTMSFNASLLLSAK